MEAMEGISLVSDAGPYNSSCGYCKSEEGSRSHGMIAEKLSVSTYQDLIDRGWRRSGSFLYRPNMKESCCCLYTIRLDATSFNASKSQRKLLRRWKSFLAGERASSDINGMSEDSSHDHGMDHRSRDPTDHDQRSELQDILAQTISHCIKSGSIQISSQGDEPSPPQPRINVLTPHQQNLLGDGYCFTSPVSFTFAKALEHHAQTPSDLAAEAEKLACIISSNFNFIASASSFTASSIKGHLNFKSTVVTLTSSHKEAGHKAKTFQNPKSSRGSNAPQSKPTGQPHHFEMKMVPAAYDQVSFDLYRRYQVSQHGDDPQELNPASYKRFLVDSPLYDDLSSQDQDRDQPQPLVKYGSFHQQYWLDGRLIAVGVVDVLPRCLSSVYLYWDPDLAHLGLGKLTALLEIQWVQSRSLNPPLSPPRNLHWYYMGYYIPTCPKMRYKADYSPSDLLSPLSLLWVRLSESIGSALDSLDRPFLELSDLEGAITFPNLSSGQVEDENIQDVMICVNSDLLISWGDLKSRLRRGQGAEIEKNIVTWKGEVGTGLRTIYYSI